MILTVLTLIAASDVPLLGVLAGDVMLTVRAWRSDEVVALCEVTAGSVALVVGGVEGFPFMTASQREARATTVSLADIVTIQLVARENGSQAQLVEVHAQRRVRGR